MLVYKDGIYKTIKSDEYGIYLEAGFVKVINEVKPVPEPEPIVEEVKVEEEFEPTVIEEIKEDEKETEPIVVEEIVEPKPKSNKRSKNINK